MNAVWCRAVRPTFSMSPVRTQRWFVVTRGQGGFNLPVKNGLSGAIPAPIINSVGSFSGISEKLGMIKCPLLSKNFKNASATCLPVMYFKISASKNFLRANYSTAFVECRLTLNVAKKNSRRKRDAWPSECALKFFDECKLKRVGKMHSARDCFLC